MLWHLRNEANKQYLNINFKYKDITNPANDNRPESMPFEAFLLNIHVKNATKPTFTSDVLQASNIMLQRFLETLDTKELGLVKLLNSITIFETSQNQQINALHWTLISNTHSLPRDEGSEVKDHHK